MRDYIHKVRYIFYTLIIIETILMTLLKQYLSNNTFVFLQLLMILSFILIVNKTFDVMEKLEKKKVVKSKEIIGLQDHQIDFKRNNNDMENTV